MVHQLLVSACRGISRNTYDLKNGSPKLQLKSEPVLGASVETILLATHVSASPVLFCATKSRGSTGKFTPPSWKETVCASAQGKVGKPFAVVFGATAANIWDTVAFGPRKMELPWNLCQHMKKEYE